jgi:hypothetical protein
LQCKVKRITILGSYFLSMPHLRVDIAEFSTDAGQRWAGRGLVDQCGRRRRSGPWVAIVRECNSFVIACSDSHLGEGELQSSNFIFRAGSKRFAGARGEENDERGSMSGYQHFPGLRLPFDRAIQCQYAA